MKTALLSALFLAACHHPSKCERFAHMEGHCGDVSQQEIETTSTLARSMCEAADSKDPAVAKAGDHFAREADCALQTDDCDEYKKCRAAVR